MTDAWAIFLQAGLGAFFLSAAIAKTATHASIAPILAAIGIPPDVVRPLARLAPLLEAAAGALLLTGVFGVLALLPALGLAIAFAAVQIRAHTLGVSQPCRCFGAFDTGRISWISVARAVGLVAAVLGAIAVTVGAGGLAPLSLEADYGAAAVGAATGLAIAAAFAVAEQVRMFEVSRPRIISYRPSRAWRSATNHDDEPLGGAP
jgi:hypothetical protein